MRLSRGLRRVDNFLPELIADYRYLGIFLLMFVESFIPIFPTEIVIPLSGVFAAEGKLSFAGVVAAGTGGSMSGATLWYIFARALGYKRFRHLATRFGWITTLTAREVDWLHTKFEKFGAALAFFGRFIPGIRNLVSIPAGLVAIPYWKFLLFSVAGAGLSNTLFAAAGWMLQSQYHKVENYVGPVTTLLIAGLVLVWVVRIAIGFVRRRAVSDGSELQ
jgi:membrane protein DedA with SNARE-associated domain